MEENMKEVNYFQYCPNCKHETEPDDFDPCHYCLEEPMRQYSHKPLNYEPKERKWI